MRHYTSSVINLGMRLVFLVFYMPCSDFHIDLDGAVVGKHVLIAWIKESPIAISSFCATAARKGCEAGSWSLVAGHLGLHCCEVVIYIMN